MERWSLSRRLTQLLVGGAIGAAIALALAAAWFLTAPEHGRLLPYGGAAGALTGLAVSVAAWRRGRRWLVYGLWLLGPLLLALLTLLMAAWMYGGISG